MFDHGEDASAVAKLIREASSNVAAITTDFPLMGEAARSELERCRAQLETARQNQAMRERLVQDERKITQAVEKLPDDLDGYLTALQDSVRAFPGTARSRAFEQVLAEQANWKGFLLWVKLAAGWKPTLDQVEPWAARARAEECRKLLASQPLMPETATAKDFQAFFEAIGRRDGEDGGLRKSLNSLYTDRLLDGLYAVRIKVGDDPAKVYYATTRPQDMAGGGKKFDYLIGFDGRTRSVTQSRAFVMSSELSAQSAIAAEFKRVLSQDTTLADWDVLMVDYGRKIATAPGIDALFKIVLLKKHTDYAGKGSEPLHVALRPLVQAIDGANIDENLPWMNPDDQDAAAARPKAEEFVKTLPSWDNILVAVRQQNAERRARLDGIPRPVGWLAKDRGMFACRTRTQLPPRGDLLVITTAAVPDQPGIVGGVWKKLGILRDGAAAVDQTQVRDLIEGRLVFCGSAPAQPETSLTRGHP